MPSNKKLERSHYGPGTRDQYFEVRDRIFGKNVNKFSLWDYELFYWVNFFSFDNPDIEVIKDQIIWSLWTSGNVCVMKVDGKFVVGVPAPKKWNIYNKIQEFDFIRIGAGVNTTSLLFDYETKFGKESMFFSKLTRDDCAVVSTSFLFNPWANGISFFQGMLNDAVNNIEVNIENIRNSRVVFGDKEELQKEMSSISKYAQNVIMLPEGTEVGSWGLDDRTDSCWVNFESVIDNFEKFRGLRNIQNEKKERKISVEAVSESMSFEYKERDKIRVIQELMDEIKRVFGIDNVSFTTLVDEIIKENEIFEKGNNKNEPNTTQKD